VADGSDTVQVTFTREEIEYLLSDIENDKLATSVGNKLLEAKAKLDGQTD
jgi:hypothetical protein